MAHLYENKAMEVIALYDQDYDGMVTPDDLEPFFNEYIKPNLPLIFCDYK